MIPILCKAMICLNLKHIGSYTCAKTYFESWMCYAESWNIFDIYMKFKDVPS